MAEYIDRERLLRKFNIDDMMNVNGTLISLREARETISNFPAADVVTVVRCEKCAHHEDEQPGTVYCQQIVGGWVPNEFFCAEGVEQNDRRKSMGRLISADALVKNHFSDEHNIALSYANKIWMRQIINAEPTVDAVPRELFDKLLKDMCEMCFMWGDGLCPFCEWKEYRTDANEPNRA